MTEAEWLASEDPGAMLYYLQGSPPSQPARISDRKLRLFACAIARLAVPSPGRVVREDVVTAERYADGLATASELAQARIASDLWCCDPSASVAAEASARILRPGPGAALLRDLGNPMRPVTLPTTGLRCPDCLDHPGLDGRLTDAGRCRSCGGSARVKRCPWLTPAVLALARAAYDLRAPDGLLEADRLAVLADALSDAGCDEQSLLDHLRSPGPHARGCWALDLLLGKE